MTVLLPLLSAAVLSGCLNNDDPQPVNVPPATIPNAVFDCAAWPKPPAEAKSSQKHIAAWLEGRVKPAFDDCKDKLGTAKILIQKKTP